MILPEQAGVLIIYEFLAPVQVQFKKFQGLTRP
jgi:hypothetical protein